MNSTMTYASVSQSVLYTHVDQINLGYLLQMYNPYPHITPIELEFVKVGPRNLIP
jgi:hypothetical protein